MDTNKLQNEPEQTSVLTDTVIRIIDIRGNNELVIEGGDRTITYPEKWVKWVIATEKVSEFYLILPDNDPSIIFGLKPEKQSGSRDWKGKIKMKEDLPHQKQVEEKYTIIYKKQAPDNKLYIYDPIIQVNN